MVKITHVAARSHAFRAGIKEGDFLISVNSHDIHDVLDYRFYLAERTVELELKRNDENLRKQFVFAGFVHNLQKNKGIR